jgi:hypothetical protein
VVRLFRGLDQALTLLERVSDRLFDEARHARTDAFETLLDVQLVRRGDHHPLGLVLGEALGKRPVKRHTELLRDLGCLWPRVDDGRERAIGTRDDLLDVAQADDAGPGDRDPDFGHLASFWTGARRATLGIPRGRVTHRRLGSARRRAVNAF